MGSVEDSKHTGRPCSIHTKENKQQVAQAFIKTPSQSAKNDGHFEHKF